MNNSLNIKEHKFEWLIAVFFPILMLFPHLVSIYLVVLIAYVIYMHFRKIISFKWNRFGFLFIALYLAYTIGVFWSNNMSLAMKYQEYKLSFIILPLLFSFDLKRNLELKIVFIGLISAVIISFISGVIIGTPCYLMYGSFPYCYIKGHLSTIVHPSYISAYAVLAVAATYYLFKNKVIGFLFLITIITVLIVYITLLMSLAGLITLVLLIGGFIVYRLYVSLAVWKASLITFTLLIGTLIMVVSLPFLKDDIAEANNKTKSFFNNPTEFIAQTAVEPTGTETRLIMWHVSLEEIKKNPMGVGTGNIDKHLSKNLISKGKDEMALANFNPHNQFMQTCLEIGIPGLLILILIYFGGLYKGWKDKNIWLTLLFLSLILNSLVESMLQKQSGIVFYTFMFFVFDLYSSKKALTNKS